MFGGAVNTLEGQVLKRLSFLNSFSWESRFPSYFNDITVGASFFKLDSIHFATIDPWKWPAGIRILWTD